MAGKDLLSTICSILIKNGSTDEESFCWYKRGVELELKITNLYEYFMQSVPESYKESFPRNLLLYFQMDDRALNSAQRALLYANVIEHQPEDSDIYRRYRDKIEAFMLDQLLERRLSENMTVIYDRFLVEELLTLILPRLWRTLCSSEDSVAPIGVSDRYRCCTSSCSRRSKCR